MTRSAAWILLVALAAPAAAQDADNFGQLIDLIEPGDIRVTLTGDPQPRAAQLVGLTPRVLTVRVDGQQLELSRADVQAVHYSFDDPVSDGFWHGVGAGLGFYGAALFALCAVSNDCPPNYLGFAIVGGAYGVAGGLIGIGIDSLKRTEARWPATPPDAWRVTPLLTPDRRGVAVSLSF